MPIVIETTWEYIRLACSLVAALIGSWAMGVAWGMRRERRDRNKEVRP